MKIQGYMYDIYEPMEFQTRDIFLGGATFTFARGARENFIALHLDFIALHLGVERYTSRWSAIKFSRATENVTQHLN